MLRTEAFPSRLYAITDRGLCAPQPLLEVVRELMDAGVRFLQVREKDLDSDGLRRLAEPIVRLCHAYGARVLINGDASVAAAVGADGVHLPWGEVPVSRAFAEVERPQWVGCSTHDWGEVRARKVEGADFVVFGPVFPSDTKPGYGPATGLEPIRGAAEAVGIPVFALGGITPDRAKECLDAGAYGVAVMGGVMREGRADRARAYLRGVGE